MTRTVGSVHIIVTGIFFYAIVPTALAAILELTPRIEIRGYKMIRAYGSMNTKVKVEDPGLSGKGNPDNFGKGEGSEFVIWLPIA